MLGYFYCKNYRISITRNNNLSLFLKMLEKSIECARVIDNKLAMLNISTNDVLSHMKLESVLMQL